MNEDIRNNAFIPCGDSMEKMNGEILDNELEQVAGGTNAMNTFKRCPKCMRSAPPLMQVDGVDVYYCKSCKEMF